MPHIVIDYTDGLDGTVDVPALVAELHPLVVDRVALGRGGQDARAPSATTVDGVAAPFVHVSVEVLPAARRRSRPRSPKTYWRSWRSTLSPVAGVTYSVEVRDLDPSYRLYPTH
ncbi:hypothetical protein [Streptomyces sp. KL116D]|uniref:hypothetical protein n=1 Tax=Streptomyces sp. KL116D TaxID=3045152 RepID=UPI003558DF1A